MLVSWGPDGRRDELDLARDVAALATLPSGRWLVLCRSRYRFMVAWLAAQAAGAVVVTAWP